MSERDVDVHHLHHALAPHTNRTPLWSLKFWKVPLPGASEEKGGEVSPGINLFPPTDWVDSSFRDISSLQGTLLQLSHLACVSGATLLGETFCFEETLFTPRDGLHPCPVEPLHGMSAPIQERNVDASNKFKTTVYSHFPMPSETVLEENLSYPEIVQGTWMLVVTYRAESPPVRVR